jgi:hypothetical protein
VRIVEELLTRRRARSWQRWTEIEPMDDYARRAGIGTAIAVLFFLLLFIAIVVAVILDAS